MSDIHNHIHDHDDHPASKWAALGVTALAGGCTMLGGLALFFVKRFKPVPFSTAMGFAAGVMIWVTMSEMVGHALENTKEGLIAEINPDPEHMQSVIGCSHLLGTAFIGLGWILCWLMSWGMTCLMNRFTLMDTVKYTEDGKLITVDEGLSRPTLLTSQTPSTSSSIEAPPEPSPQASLIRERLHICTDPFFDQQGRWDEALAREDLLHEETGFSGWLIKRQQGPSEETYIRQKLTNEVFRTDQKAFVRVSLFAALALGIHNLPEGLATYTSYMNDPKLGIGMALAIAVHNIPEGIAVAVPCYFGTGCWWKAMLLCFASAIAEPIGALLGIGISSIHESVLFDGLLMGLIGGFMLRVAIAELLITGLKYDPNNMIMIFSTAIGFSVMAISLALFEFIPGGHVH